MSELTLEALGLDQEKLTERLLDRLTEAALSSVAFDEDGEEYPTSSPLMRKLKERMTAYIDEAVTRLADEHIKPRVDDLILGTEFQKSNAWGEPKAPPMTWKEYLASKAESYLTEKVDSGGKSQADNGGYSWSGTQTRVTYMVHQHLHYEIDRQMKAALSTANAAIAQGIQETVKIKLSEIANGLKTTVAIK